MVGQQVKWKILVFLGLFFTQVLPAAASEETELATYHVVRDCQEEWLVYSQEYANYVPYIRALHESEPSVSILLNLLEDRHFYFLLKTDREVSLFIDGALQGKVDPEKWAAFSCDSLLQRYGKNEVMLTVFGMRGLEGIRSVMAFPKGMQSGDSLQVLTPSLILLKPRQADIFRDFSVIAWLMILLVGAVVFLAAPPLAYRLMNPVSFFSKDFRAEIYHHHRAYSPIILAATLALALITSFLLLLIETYIAPIASPLTSMADAESVWGLTLDYLKVTLLCFVLFYFKYFLISTTLGILNMGELTHIHFIKAVQSSILFYGLVSAGLQVLLYQNPQLLEGVSHLLLVGIITYYSVRLLVLYVLLNPPGRFINLYLISYLCVVELIPLVIGIKFVM